MFKALFLPAKRFMKWLHVYLKYVRYSEGNIVEKLLLLLFIVVSLVDRARIHSLLKFLRKVVVYRVRDVKYGVVDLESIAVVSPSFEPWLWKYRVQNFEGIIDIGAHVGKYSLYFARVNPKAVIVALEPYPENYHCLLRGISANNLRNIIPLRYAAYHEDNQVVKLYIAPRSN